MEKKKENVQTEAMERLLEHDHKSLGELSDDMLEGVSGGYVAKTNYFSIFTCKKCGWKSNAVFYEGERATRDDMWTLVGRHIEFNENCNPVFQENVYDSNTMRCVAVYSD